jgi:ADP-heptose:LPS heptosyltransferase
MQLLDALVKDYNVFQIYVKGQDSAFGLDQVLPGAIDIYKFCNRRDKDYLYAFSDLFIGVESGPHLIATGLGCDSIVMLPDMSIFKTIVSPINKYDDSKINIIYENELSVHSVMKGVKWIQQSS